MKLWEKVLIVAGVVVAATLAILPWIDRWFPTDVRMAPVVETSEPETAQAELLPEEPLEFSPETEAIDLDEQSVESAELPEPSEPVDADVPDVPEAIVPEELPPPPPPQPPPIEP